MQVASRGPKDKSFLLLFFKKEVFLASAFPKAPVQTAPLALHIDHMGQAGDGAARAPDGRALHVPFTLPGEDVLATADRGPRAICDEILRLSPDRAIPPCPHFGVCGGCALQHWADEPYAAWKSSLIDQALVRAGFVGPALAPLARTPPGARRRMDFAVRRSADGVRLGLHQSHSGMIVDLQVCCVLDQRLAALLPPLRAMLATLSGLRKAADLAINLVDNGADLLIRADAPASAADRGRLATFARAHDIARIAWAVGAGVAETAAQFRAPAIRFADATVSPPPGAFLQASPQGEAAIVAAVIAALPKLSAHSLMIELYAGIGTLSLPLAAHGRVRAYEGAADAYAALRQAAGGTRIEAVHRDLVRQPLQVREFRDAACIVLDPPFGGAPAQMEALAASGLPIVYVSCNPAALTRDAAVLAQAGYTLGAVCPIDQFLWSAQVEAVCRFLPPRKKARQGLLS